MQVILMHHTPLNVCSRSIRKCWDSTDKSDTVYTEDGHGYFVSDSDEDIWSIDEAGPEDKALIDKIGNKFKHSSTLEHLVYNFEIKGISRGCLQELARHRIASYSVKSTRYTLKELKRIAQIDTTEAGPWEIHDVDVCERYLVMTGNEQVDFMSCLALANLQQLIKNGVANDMAKYALPEAYKTELAWTINARALQNFLSLRSHKDAHWEIRKLAREIFEALPEEHKYLFEEYMRD